MKEDRERSRSKHLSAESEDSGKSMVCYKRKVIAQDRFPGGIPSRNILFAHGGEANSVSAEKSNGDE